MWHAIWLKDRADPGVVTWSSGPHLGDSACTTVQGALNSKKYDVKTIWRRMRNNKIWRLKNMTLGGCGPPDTPLGRPTGLQDSLAGLIEWQPGWLSSLLVWLSDIQDGCPVDWFDRVAARMAVQFTGLIEWQPGWLSSWLVWLSDCQDGWFLEWVVSSTSKIRGSWRHWQNQKMKK